jgi:hypothetical protein
MNGVEKDFNKFICFALFRVICAQSRAAEQRKPREKSGPLFGSPDCISLFRYLEIDVPELADISRVDLGFEIQGRTCGISSIQ